MDSSSLIGAALAVLAATNAQAQARQVVHSGDDLPRFTYSVPGKAIDVLASTPDQFEAFAKPVVADDDRTLATYDIQDKATLREILRARLGAQIASGRQDALALRTVAELQAAEDKAEAKLTSGLVYQAFLEARLQTHDAPGVCPAGFAAAYTHQVDGLPWSVVSTRVKSDRGLAQIATPGHCQTNGKAKALLGASRTSAGRCH